MKSILFNKVEKQLWDVLMGTENDIGLIEEFCLTENLKSYDPYDVWMTDFGIRVKQWYNTNKVLGLLPAAAVTVWDQFLNNTSRFGYEKQEYPTVRAMAALTLLNVYQKNGNKEVLIYAKNHVDWLIDHTCIGYSGLCWGLGFKWAAGDGLDYNENTPFTTHTPYVLEAIHNYVEITSDFTYVQHIRSVFDFYENDIQIIYEDEVVLATSYGPEKDRLVTNAVSYTLYAYAIFLVYFPEKGAMIKGKIQKLYNFIQSKQLSNGSWLYEPDNPNSFIDCFHSCFILKNVFKANQIITLQNSQELIEAGYEYIKNEFFDENHKLFRRFTLSNKPSIVKFDLYDNAEVLNLSILLDDQILVSTLGLTIRDKFIEGNKIYSVIDWFGFKRNKNTLRWAVMPYLYALSANYK